MITPLLNEALPGGLACVLSGALAAQNHATRSADHANCNAASHIWAGEVE